MCSGCNGEYSSFIKQERFKYLDKESIMLLVLHDILTELQKLGQNNTN